MVRWPDGVEKSSFSRRTCPRHAPDWIRTARVGTAGRTVGERRFPLIDDVEGLPWRPTSPHWSCPLPQWALGPRVRTSCRTWWVRPRHPVRGPTVVDCARVAERIADRLASTTCWSTRARAAAQGCSSTCRSGLFRAPSATSEFPKDPPRTLAAEYPGPRGTAVRRRPGRPRPRSSFATGAQNNPQRRTIASTRCAGRPVRRFATAGDLGRGCGRAGALRTSRSSRPTCRPGSPSTATCSRSCSPPATPGTRRG